MPSNLSSMVKNEVTTPEEKLTKQCGVIIYKRIFCECVFITRAIIYQSPEFKCIKSERDEETHT